MTISKRGIVLQQVSQREVQDVASLQTDTNLKPGESPNSASSQVVESSMLMNRAEATNIAQQAALEAKAASDAQLIAGQQAPRQVSQREVPDVASLQTDTNLKPGESLSGTDNQVEESSMLLNRAEAMNIAQKAALEAKAASDAQFIAGQQASHQVPLREVRDVPNLQTDTNPKPDESANSASSQAQSSMLINRAKTTNIAQKAALEAKAASDAQLIAGQQASHQVRVQLAEKAQQAAQSAQAALSAKQSIVEQLEDEVREAEAVVQEEGASLQQFQQEVQAATVSAQQAKQQLKVLQSAVQLEQSNVASAEMAHQGAQQELAEKTQLAEAAKHRVQVLIQQLSVARADLTNTKQACNRALQSAAQAKSNAEKN
ncbi:uncharacterized abhydrolase domain-containing protein DDB_G0269086-like [Anabrus simplex]|uniref:uncharacterized abhydrolase domain-containing protein DDB_G0269086-like n=1 Tax=Anabrus simplex TaxID=316456 RepID=UPI0035A3C642